MKALVTGGTGFIGSHLIERLRAGGTQVVCVAKDALNAAVLERLDVTVILGDLNDGSSWDSMLSGADYIYHVAGVTRCRHPREYYEGNYLATKNFLERCRSICANLKRLVYVSSLAAAGPSLDGNPLREDAPYHPVSHYGRSKMLGEIEVLKASSFLPITVLRPSIVYGPRERDMYDYIRMIQRGVHLLVGFSQKLLSIIHSDDLIDGIIRASESKRSEGEVYNLGSETPYTTQQLGGTIARVLGRHPVCIYCPHALTYTIGALGEAIGRVCRKQVFFNIQKAKESVQPAWICSVEKAKDHLGFRQQVSLEDGVRRTCAWYRENGWL